jgi:glycerol uptake operon antiterminator
MAGGGADLLVLGANPREIGMKQLRETLARAPIIAAIKNERELESAFASSCQVLFMLTGNICNIQQIIKQTRLAQKKIYLHIDLLEGFGRDRYALRYIKSDIAPDGIITTKSNLVKIGLDLKIFTIQRIFMIDTLSFASGVNSVQQLRPDAVEIMPGIMPAITKSVCEAVRTPVIIGGLVSSESDVRLGLQAGALGVSTSNQNLWRFVNSKNTALV